MEPWHSYCWYNKYERLSWFLVLERFESTLVASQAFSLVWNDLFFKLVTLILFSITFKAQESELNKLNWISEVNVILSGLEWKELEIFYELFGRIYGLETMDPWRGSLTRVRFISSIGWIPKKWELSFA